MVAILKRSKRHWLLGLLVFGSTTLLERHLEPLPDNHGSYFDFWAGSEYDGSSMYCVRRLTKQTIDLVQCFVISLFLPLSDDSILAKYGPGAIYSFCLHEVVLKALDTMIVKTNLTVTSHLGHSVVVAGHVPYAFLIMHLLTTRPVRMICDVALKPKWLCDAILPREPPTDDRAPIISIEGGPPLAEKSLLSTDYLGPLRCCDDDDVELGRPDPVVPEDDDVPADATTVLLETKDARGPETLDGMTAGHPMMRWLMYPFLIQAGLAIIGATLLVPMSTTVVLAFERTALDLRRNPYTMLYFWTCVVGLVISVSWSIVLDGITFMKIKRGLDRPKTTLQTLQHVVLICQYKEPREILEATLGSLASQTHAKDVIVVLACEDRDPTADETFEYLDASLGPSFRSLWRTTHVLRTTTEIAGKSSNENYAARVIWQRLIIDGGLDPGKVMLTIADADSLFDSVFLEHVEAEYHRVPDGSRCIFDAPTHITRNLPECEALIQHFEIARTHFCTFYRYSMPSFAQSNYSLTLAFARDLNFWDPLNTSEDMHTTLKALCLTAGADVVVPVWSLILNDAVPGYGDRWDQAKRHMWGVEEIAWITAQFRNLRFKVWLHLTFLVYGQFAKHMTPSWIVLFVCPQPRRLFLSLQRPTQRLLLGVLLVGFLLDWLRFFAREAIFRSILLSRRKPGHIMTLSPCRWALLVILYPINSLLAPLLFNTLATWRMLAHARVSPTLKYITAPKTSSSWASLKDASSQQPPL